MLVTDHEGSGEEQHEGREDVAQALLRGDAHDDPSNAGADEKVLERDAQNAEEGEDQDQETQSRHHEADDGCRFGVGSGCHEVAEPGRESTNRDGAGDEEHRGRHPGDHPRVHRGAVELAPVGPDHYGGYSQHRPNRST